MLQFKTRPDEFEEFRKSLDIFLGEDYELAGADLSLTTYRMIGHNQETYGDAEIFLRRFDNGKRRGLKINLGHTENTSDEEKEIIKWLIL